MNNGWIHWKDVADAVTVTKCPSCGDAIDLERPRMGREECLFQARFRLQETCPEARFFCCCGDSCSVLGGCVMLKKPVKSSRPTGYDSSLQELFPTVADFLCQSEWEDESGKMVARETGSVVLFVQDGRLKVSVNDPAMLRVAFLTLDGPDTLWSSLEAHLSKDDMDWRHKPKDKWRK